MGKYPDINITKDDLCKIIYFILMKFNGDALHMQGTSSKRDLIGGYIERWFNKIAETVIFDSLLSKKNYRVVSDYFIYGNDSDKNAPDIIGLEKKDGTTIPFVKYNSGTWETVVGMPRIEVKVIRKDQALIGVREPQMIDDFYVFIESDLEPDYLTAVFEEELFSEKYYKKLETNNIFIEGDANKQIIPHSKMKKAERIGSMRLIGIYTKEELRNNTVLCGQGVKPYYFSNAQNVNGRLNFPLGESIHVNAGGMLQYILEGGIYLPIFTEGLVDKTLAIIKKNKGSVYLNLPSPAIINGVSLSAGPAKIEFKKFDRSSSWDENIGLQFTLENHAKDSTKYLLDLLDKHV